MASDKDKVVKKDPANTVNRVCFYIGAFKPPTILQLNAAIELSGLDQVSKLIVLISNKEYGGITANMSKNIWDIYLQNVGVKINTVISDTASPVNYLFTYLNRNESESIYIVSSGGDDYINNLKETFGDRVDPIDNPEDQSLIEGTDLEAMYIELKETGEAIQSGKLDDREFDINKNKYFKILEDIKKMTPPAVIQNGRLNDILKILNIPIIKNEDIVKEAIRLWENTMMDVIKDIEVEDVEEKSPDVLNSNKFWDKTMKKEEGDNFIDKVNKVVEVAPEKWYDNNFIAIPSLDISIDSLKVCLDRVGYELKEKIDKNVHLDPFIKWVCGIMEIDEPKVNYLKRNINDEQVSYGAYNPNTKEINLYIENRSLGDIMRTLAHEMVHFKQDKEGRLDNNSGEDGSPIEDEANVIAAILMRHYGRNNPIIFTA